jgi:uncharacterized repeat protein (TIGR03809 family)
MVQATVKLEAVALKWRALAERRRDHHIDLYKTGRWQHYYSDQEFLSEMRAAIALAQRWARIAPRPDERDAAAREQAKIAELVKVVEFLEAKAA